MLRRTLFLLAPLLALTTPFPATALVVLPEIPTQLVEYAASSGSLPPEYAWNTQVVIWTDGKLKLTHCKGYQTDGPSCTISHAQIAAADIDRIIAALSASHLANRAAKAQDSPPVGGGSQRATFWMDDKPIVLPAFPIESDQRRVRDVLDSIIAAIPKDLRDTQLSGN